MTHFKQQCSFCSLTFPKAVLGFSLFELLVALAIFAVIAVMAYGGVDTILRARLQTDLHATRLARLQMALTWLGRDIKQYVARPIRDQYGDRQVALQGSLSYLELTRAGWRNPAQQPRSTLQRVAYVVEDRTLIRSYWRMLDRAQDASPIKMDLLGDVDGFTLRYLDSRYGKLQWHEQWLPLNEYGDNFFPPKAIEVTLIVKGWGRIVRLFLVPGA